MRREERDESRRTNGESPTGVIELDGLTKRFGSVTALDGLSMTVPEGSVFGFLGPNGAGKSTTINILLDFTKSTSGSARVFGQDARRESVAIRRRTGTLLEGYGVYPRLTGREHLEHAIETKGAADDPDDLLARVNLGGDADRRAGGYSKGMAQRLAIAVALVGEPDLLVLDEPSTGLDPNGVRTLREIVRAERDRGATVFFSSHVLEDVEAVADRVAILLDGTLAAEGRVEDLRAELDAGTTLEVEVAYVPDGLLAGLDGIAGVRDAIVRSGREVGRSRLDVVCDGGDAKLEALNRVAEAGVFEDFGLREASLGEVFSRYTEDSTPDAKRVGVTVGRTPGIEGDQ